MDIFQLIVSISITREKVKVKPNICYNQ